MWLGGGDQQPESTDGHGDPIADFDDADVDDVNNEDLHRAAYESDAMEETRCGCTLHGTRCLESALPSTVGRGRLGRCRACPTGSTFCTCECLGCTMRRGGADGNQHRATDVTETMRAPEVADFDEAAVAGGLPLAAKQRPLRQPMQGPMGTARTPVDFVLFPRWETECETTPGPSGPVGTGEGTSSEAIDLESLHDLIELAECGAAVCFPAGLNLAEAKRSLMFHRARL